MRSKSLLMFIVAAFFLLSCATVGPKSALQRNDPQTVVEEKWVSGIQYYLEDIYDYDADSKILPDYFAILSKFNEDLFPTAETVAKQMLVSGIRYYLEDMDMEDMDRAFYTNEPVIKQTADSKILPDYFAVLSKFNENPFSTTETVARQTLVSAIQYYLEDIDNSFFITKTTGRR